MSEKFRGVEESRSNQVYDPKKLNLPYTILIFKPEICLNWAACQEILATLESKGFEIRSVASREITRQEAENLYYRHASKDYFAKIIAYATTGESLVVLLSHSTQDPIPLLKTIIGNKDPEVAKKNEPTSLRAKYGIDIIKNEFFCSDDQIGANKDRDIFRFPIPQKEPELTIDSSKLGLNTLWTFLHPKNLEHCNINGRLDVFAKYGPITKRFPINRFTEQS